MPQPRSPHAPPLLDVRNLTVAYPKGTALVSVVENVSFTVAEGEVVGLVGESGSGKTQTIYAVLGLLSSGGLVTSGSVRLEGRELIGAGPRVLRTVRGSLMSYIPQEPMMNLDPSFSVGSQLIYGIRAQMGGSRAAARRLALEMLDRVGIEDPARTFRAYPHEISGGMAQRVLIAGSVACKPRLLIADEPTTALDVTVQAEVLDLLRGLQKEDRMGLLLVTHNFGVVADLCDTAAVMQAGRIVEQRTVEDIFRYARHEYTRSLLDAILDESTIPAKHREGGAR